MVDDTPCTFRRPLNASIAINKQRPLPVTQYDVVSLYLQRALRSLAEGKGRNKSDSRPLDFPVFSLVHLILLAFVPTYLKRYESRGRRRVSGSEICEGELLNRDGDILEKPRDIPSRWWKKFSPRKNHPLELIREIPDAKCHLCICCLSKHTARGKRGFANYKRTKLIKVYRKYKYRAVCVFHNSSPVS